MTDTEYRALIEHHARELTVLNKEPERGYGLKKKESIVQTVERMRQLADNLDG